MSVVISRFTPGVLTPGRGARFGRSFFSAAGGAARGPVPNTSISGMHAPKLTVPIVPKTRFVIVDSPFRLLRQRGGNAARVDPHQLARRRLRQPHRVRRGQQESAALAIKLLHHLFRLRVDRA